MQRSRCSLALAISLIGACSSSEQTDNDHVDAEGSSDAGRSGSGGRAGTGGATSGPGGVMGAAGAAGATGVGGASGAGAAGSGGAAGAGGSAGAGGASARADDGGSGAAVRSAGCGKTRSLQNGQIAIQSSGMSRMYILTVPSTYDNNHPYRLILAYHWYYADANQVATAPAGSANETPYYGLLKLANNSTIFIAPNGTGPNASTLGWPNTNGQDVIFTDDILKQVEGDLCIDTTRIFATGFSYGAAMSFALGCARPDVFRAVLPYSAGPLSGCEGGTPKKPVAYFASHGIGDTVLKIPGGRSMRDDFVKASGCTPQSPPEPASGSGTHICTSYQGCSAGHPVRWCAFDGGHWPSQHDTGKPTTWVPGEAWAFIGQF